MRVLVYACSAAVDSWMMGGYGKRLFPLLGIEPPYTPGRDLIGEVVELGPLSWKFRVGDMVAAALHPTAPGAHAEYAACPDSGTDFKSN